MGTVHYIGKYGTGASKAEYARLIAKWSTGGSECPAAARDEITIIELLAAFRRHAVKHYRKDGRLTGEVLNFDHAIKPLKMLYGKRTGREISGR